MDTAEIRRFYAEEIRAVANIQSEPLVEAFAKVPRERFLGPGPWRIFSLDAPRAFSPGGGPRLAGGYRTTVDADLRHLYHNGLVAIDAERMLNNGQPSALAAWLDTLELRGG